MSLYHQLVHERLACLEPMPGQTTLREALPANEVAHVWMVEAVDLELLFAGTSECVQLTPGRFRAEVTSTTVGGIGFHRVALNCGVLWRSEVGHDRVLIGIVDSTGAARIIENGKLRAPGSAIVVSRRDMTLSVLGPATISWLSIDLAALEQRHRAEIELLLRLDVDASADTLHADITALRSFVLERLVRARRPRPALSRDVEAFLVELEAMRRIAGVLRHSPAASPTHSDRRRLDLVLSAEQFMWSNIEGPLTLAEICAARKCKARSLIYSFKSLFGLSPMKYFKIRRLNAARRKLRTATGPTRIFDVAADCGFWHMGHFGADYKALFGVTPEGTLKYPRISVGE